MQSQNIEITFPNFQKQGVKFLKLLRQTQANFSKNENASRCQLGFQIQQNYFHIYTAQQTLLEGPANAIYMLTSFRKGFYSIKNPPSHQIAFGVRVCQFISKILVCKQQIEQVKVILSGNKVYFHLTDRGSNGFIDYPMNKFKLEVRNLNYSQLYSDNLITIGQLSQSYITSQKKSIAAVENLYLNQNGILIAFQMGNNVFLQHTIKTPIDLKNYSFQNIRRVYHGTLKIQLYQSVHKSFSFFKTLDFHGAQLKLYSTNSNINDQRLFIQFENQDYKVCKTFAARLSQSSEANNAIIRQRTVQRGLMQTSIRYNAPQRNTKIQQGMEKGFDQNLQQAHNNTTFDFSRQNNNFQANNCEGLTIKYRLSAVGALLGVNDNEPIIKQQDLKQQLKPIRETIQQQSRFQQQVQLPKKSFHVTNQMLKKQK